MRTVTTFSGIQIPYFPQNLLNSFLTLFLSVLSFSIICISAAHHRSGSKWRRGCRSQCLQINVPASRETWLCLSFPREFNPGRACVWFFSRCLSPLHVCVWVCVCECVWVCVWACAYTWTLWDTGSASLAARPADRNSSSSSHGSGMERPLDS